MEVAKTKELYSGELVTSTNLKLEMVKLHREIVKYKTLPLDRLCRMSIEELNSHTEVCEDIVARLGQEGANKFAAQYLLLLPDSVEEIPLEVVIEPKVNDTLTDVVLTDEQFDLVEDAVTVVGVASKSTI